MLALLGVAVLGFLVASVVVAWIGFARSQALADEVARLAFAVKALEVRSRSASSKATSAPAAPAVTVAPAPASMEVADSTAALAASSIATVFPAAPAIDPVTASGISVSTPEAIDASTADTPPPPPPSAWRSPKQPATDWAAFEATVGKRWMTWVGAMVVFIAGAFFVHYSYTHGLIGPFARMLLGLAAGAGVGIAGDRALRRGFRALGQGLIGLGLGLVYAAWYSGFALGDAPVIGQGTAFAGMIVATAIGVALALLHDAQAIAIIATLGGLLTPVLVADGSGSREGLFSYLVVLDLGVVAVAFAKQWRALDKLAFAGTAALAAGWWIGHEAAGHEWATVGWVLVFSALFLLLPLAFHLRRRQALGAAALLAVEANAALATLALWIAQGEAHPRICAALIALLAAAHAVIAVVAPRLFADDRRSRASFAAIAAALAAIAVPIAWGGAAVTWAWAVQATLLTWLGGRYRDRGLRLMGAAVGIACALRTLIEHLPGTQAPNWPLLNLAFANAAVGPLLLATLALLARCLAEPEVWEVSLARAGAAVAALWLALIGSLDINAHGGAAPAAPEAVIIARFAGWYLTLAVVFVVAWCRRQNLERLVPAVILALMAAVAVLSAYGEPDPGARALGSLRFAVGSALVVLGFVWARRCVPPVRWWLLGGGGLWTWALLSCETWTATDAAAGDRTALLALSIAWIAYAILLLTLGFARGWRPLRFAALGLFGLTMLKLVLVDLDQLQELQRIASFAITGVVMIAASWAYHRLERRFGAR